MNCEGCGLFNRRHAFVCEFCKRPLAGGIVFVTSISGTGTAEKMADVVKAAKAAGHEHDVEYHDVGRVMKGLAREVDPDVVWERILEFDPVALSYLRAHALENIARAYAAKPDHLHLIDIHLTFRWHPYTTPGLLPHMLQVFRPYVRCFINMMGDLSVIHDTLATKGWGKRDVMQLLLWRDEELFMTDMFASMSGRVPVYAVAMGEPATTLENLIWHPGKPKVYLARPMANLEGDEGAKREVREFQDRLRDFLVVFDPETCGDFDEARIRREMTKYKGEIGKVTVDRDFRFIDQADALVVYYPKVVSSPGVDAEMAHARRIGKPIYLYAPEDLGVSPFVVPADKRKTDKGEFFQMLKYTFTKGDRKTVHGGEKND